MARKLLPRREAGRQLSQIQFGLDPDHWKPFNEVGAGTKEIIIDFKDGWYRVMYVAKFSEKQDKALAKARYDGVVSERNQK